MPKQTGEPKLASRNEPSVGNLGLTLKPVRIELNRLAVSVAGFQSGRAEGATVPR